MSRGLNDWGWPSVHWCTFLLLLVLLVGLWLSSNQILQYHNELKSNDNIQSMKPTIIEIFYFHSDIHKLKCTKEYICLLCLDMNSAIIHEMSVIVTSFNWTLWSVCFYLYCKKYPMGAACCDVTVRTVCVSVRTHRRSGAELRGAATWLQITGSQKDPRLCQTEPSQI